MKSYDFARKRPCRICRRWFLPKARLGDRQKTCGDPECKREWHRRQCAQWNRKNQAYFRSIYLQKKMEAVENASPASTGSDYGETLEKCRGHQKKPKLPISGFQEVISVQQFVIIEYLIRLSLSRFQEVIRSQTLEKPG